MEQRRLNVLPQAATFWRMSTGSMRRRVQTIIAIAGGQNACPDAAAPFPQVSREGILWMEPEVIIDVSPPLSETKLDRKTILKDWQQVADVEAVRTGRVYVLADDFASVPGPRFILLVEKLARLLHPEVDWE